MSQEYWSGNYVQPPKDPKGFSNKKNTILLSVVIVLLVVLITVVIIVFNISNKKEEKEEKQNSETTSISDSTVGTAVEVPTFVGASYTEGEFEDENSNFLFIIEEKYDPNVEPGTIISQTPVSGEKINPDETLITIVVAVSDEQIIIPSDLIGKDYIEVKAILSELQLNVVDEEIEYSEADGAEHGTVIEVSPNEGEKVFANSTVKIKYVSYSESNTEVITMPDVRGYSYDEAERILESKGLSVKAIYDYSDTVKNGRVIKSSVTQGVKIPKGSEIVLTVSLGIMVEQTAEINVPLPNLGKRGSIVVNLDSNIVLQEDNYLFDGSLYTFTIEGYKSDSELKVFVNGKVIYSCEIDFTKSPCVLDNITFWDYVGESENSGAPQKTQIVMPDVYGCTGKEAVNKLVEAGFDKEKINIDGEGSIVVEQYPPKDLQYPQDMNISLTLGDY